MNNTIDYQVEIDGNTVRIEPENKVELKESASQRINVYAVQIERKGDD